MSDESEPDEQGGGDDEGAEVGGTLLEAGGEAAELLEVVDATLNGPITNDRFCVVRRTSLWPSWWRRPLRLR